MERYEVVDDVRGLGSHVGDRVRRADRRQPRLAAAREPAARLFAQLVVVPLFREHHILSQVAGHRLNVVKALPPLVVSQEDVDWFAAALEEVLGKAQHVSRAAIGFAARAAVRRV